MSFELGVRVNVMRLYNGHRSLFVTLTVGRRWLYVQRWDTARCPANRLRSGPMGWTWGVGP